MKIIFSWISLSMRLLITPSVWSTTGLPVRVSLFNESVPLPSTNRLVNSLNPALSVGTNGYYGQGGS